MGRHTPADSVMGRFFAAFGSGVAGALGIGGGGILIIYLAMVANIGQLKAQGINLLFFLACGGIALIIHSIKGRIDWRVALFCVLGGLPGVAVGVSIAEYISSVWLGKLFAILLIVMGIKSVFTRKKADD